MKTNPFNIFDQKNSSQNQQKTSIFDKVHSSPPQDTLFKNMQPPNNKNQKKEKINIFDIVKMPATNIFSVNPTPTSSTNTTQKTNIFATGNTKIQNKNLLGVKRPPITIFDFNTPEKNQQSPKEKIEEEKKPLEIKPQKIQISQYSEVKMEQTKKTFQIKPQHIVFDNSSPKSSNSLLRNSPSNSSSSKKNLFFQQSSSSKKTERQESERKSSQKSVEYLSAFSGRQNENSISDQTRSLQQRNQSKTSSIYTFQKRTDSKKMDNNAQQSIDDYLVLQQQEGFSFEQKFQTPRRVQQKQVAIRDEKILSTIRQIQGQESPFHRIELSGNPNQSSKIKSSSPPYMNETQSPNLSYLDDNIESSKKTSENVDKQFFQGFKSQLKQRKHENELNFQHVQIQDVTKSQDNISSINVFKEENMNEQTHKTSSPQIIFKEQQKPISMGKQQQQRKVVKLKDFLQMHFASKSPQHQLQRIQIKRTQSESDSQSHSFSSRDLGISKSPFSQPKGKFANLNRKIIESTTANINAFSKSEQKPQDLLMNRQKKQQKISQFFEVKQPVLNIIKGPEEKEEKYKDREENQSISDRTLSLDYSDMTQKIQSSTNSLVIKSLLLKQEQKLQIKQQEKVDCLRMQQKKVQKVEIKNKQELQQDQNDDNQFIVPQGLSERKITFGKTFEIKAQLKIATETIPMNSQVKKDDYKISLEKQNLSGETLLKKQQFSKQHKKASTEQYITPKLFPINKPLSQRFLQVSKGTSKQKSVSKPPIKKDQVKKQTFLNIPKQTVSGMQQKKDQNLLQIKNQIFEVKLRTNQLIQLLRNQFLNYKDQSVKLKYQDFLEQQKEQFEKIQLLVTQSLRTSNYYKMYQKAKSSKQFENEGINLWFQIQLLQKYLQSKEQWKKQIKEINKKYKQKLYQQRRDIQKQQIQKKKNSFFSIFNLKKNKFCIQTSLQRKSAWQNQKNKYFSKSNKFLNQAFKQIFDLVIKRSQKCQQKAKQILNRQIKYPYQVFKSLNVMKKQSFENKVKKPRSLLQILSKREGQQSNIQFKTRKSYFMVFKDQQIQQLSLQNKYYKSCYFQKIKEDFLSNLQKSPLKLKLLRQQRLNEEEKSHQISKYKQQWLNEIEEYQKRAHKKVYYENQYKAYKNMKNMFQGIVVDEDRLMTIEDRYEDEIRKRQKRILSKRNLLKQMNTKMSDNVLVKFRKINFKKQVFIL